MRSERSDLEVFDVNQCALSIYPKTLHNFLLLVEKNPAKDEIFAKALIWT